MHQPNRTDRLYVVFIECCYNKVHRISLINLRLLAIVRYIIGGGCFTMSIYMLITYNGYYSRILI